jgi:Ankyrin repeats (3 copies)
MSRSHAIRFGLALCLLFPWAALGQDSGDELRRAASEGNVARVKQLLESGTNVNAANRYGGTALAFACDRGQVEVVKLLLQHGADVNAKDTFYNATPLTWAAMKGNAEITRLLLDKTGQGDEQVLMMGVGGGHPALVKMVLERGKVGAEALSGALATATQEGNTEIADMLKAAGAKPPPAADFQVDAETLKSYEGAYEGPNGLVLNVAVDKDGKLTASAGGPPFVFGALDKVTFRPEQYPALKLIFTVENGKVTGATIDEGGALTPLKKKEVPQ